ncbi:MAG: hypothetical protein JW854_07860 [Actinobacteria bacterium]|nr:hypothetical protein [Actinomycetota bacterium]
MDAHDFVSFSLSKAVTPRSPLPLPQLVRYCLADYAKALEAAGCIMVGHIKGVIEDAESPPLFFSITSLTGEPQLKGGPVHRDNDLTLIMTVIVSGVEEEELSRLLENTLARYFVSGTDEHEKLEITGT